MLEARKIAAEYGTPNSQVDDGNLYFALSKCLEHIDAQPAQEPYDQTALELCNVCGWKTLIPDDCCLNCERAQPAQRQWIWLSDADIAEVVDTTCQYTGSYEEYLIKKAERKSRSMNT